MKVRELYQEKILTAGPEEDLAVAASRMRFYEVGALAVFRHGKLAGIVTEQDVVRCVSDGLDPERTTVARYMTEDPITIGLDVDVTDAAMAMLDVGARHLPVIDRGDVVGMISARDVLADEVIAHS